MAGIKNGPQGPLQRLYASLVARKGRAQAADLIGGRFIVLFAEPLPAAGGAGEHPLPHLVMRYARAHGKAPLTAANLQQGPLTVFFR